MKSSAFEGGLPDEVIENPGGLNRSMQHHLI